MIIECGVGQAAVVERVRGRRREGVLLTVVAAVCSRVPGQVLAVVLRRLAALALPRLLAVRPRRRRRRRSRLRRATLAAVVEDCSAAEMTMTGNSLPVPSRYVKGRRSSLCGAASHSWTTVALVFRSRPQHALLLCC